MRLKALGKSGFQVTPIGLGLAALGRPGYINLGHAEDLNQEYQIVAMERHTHAVLDAAWAAGIRYFDAARSYGRAENFLSSWLADRGISSQMVTIGSKWGYTYTAGWQIDAEAHEVKDHTLPVLRRQIQESRELLGEQLDLYQIHSATLESGVFGDQAVLAKLAELRNDGLRIGLTLSGSKQSQTLRRAMEIQFDGRLLFATVQATWNLLEKSAGQALSEASQAGMGIIVKEALANGRLTPRNENPAFRDKRLLLEQLADEHATTMDALALAAALAQPWADIVLSGAATVDQLQSNIGALNVTLTDESFNRLQPLVEEPATYWSTRSQLAWN